MPTDSIRDRLVEALLKCDCMMTANSREAVVRDLPGEIRGRLGGSGTTKEIVDEIVRVCAQFPGGLQTLLQRVRFFEGESFAWMEVDRVARQMSANQVSPSPVNPDPPRQEKPQEGPIELPIAVFFSYSHKDETLRDELSTHLSLLKRRGIISEWHDRQIRPGDEWKEAIDDRLDQARVILLLISADFLASDYCHEVEMKRALERHENREAVVIPIILRPCDWKGAPFGKLQALPRDARPITMWPNRDEAFTNVTEGIRKVVEGLRTGMTSK